MTGQASDTKLSEKVRGSRRSYDLALTVPSAAALTVLRNELKRDDRVQRVF